MPISGYRGVNVTVIKKSRFIATVARTDSQAQARAVIADVRATYPDARHHCVAFLIEEDEARTSHSSDDGEPAGTAGIPMLTSLMSADLVNITAVVTRYFGGIKLGASGLTRAYAGAVTLAVADMPRVVNQTQHVWGLMVTHGDAGKVAEELIRAGATITAQTYDEHGVQLRFVYPQPPDALVARVTQGSLQAVLIGSTKIEVPA